MAVAAETVISPDAKITIDFRDVDVRVVAKFISEITGKNFVFDKAVQDKVTVFSPTKVTAEEAYRLFETVLKIHGYTTVPAGNVIKIVAGMSAKTMDVETRVQPPTLDKGRDDRIVTQLVRLTYADATEVRVMLQPIIDKTGLLISYDKGNTLVVTDYATNIDRLAKIVTALDVPDKTTITDIIKLEHASAKDMAMELQQALRSPQAGAGGVAMPQPQPGGAYSLGRGYQIVADERTNSLIVAARAGEMATIKELARRLDIPSRRGSDRIHVVFLKYAVATDLAKVLSELTSKTGGVSTTGTTSTGEKKAGAPTPFVLQEEVFITAEPATNSLIIRAERQDFLVISDIIRQLDIQRAQVLVEGIIMEVSVKRANALGAEWRVLNRTISGDWTSAGGTNLPGPKGQGLINQMATQPFAGPAGLVLGAAQGTLTWGGTTYLNLGLLLQALEQDDDVNILSTPHILTMDNEEAKIIVGEERPFLKSSMATATGQVTPSVTNTYEFKDLGLTLKITPHITQGEFVRLKVFQQLKSFMGEAETGAISSTKREAETMVQVRDKETVVIGGLIGDESRADRAQVPCLGDIPLLGWGFKTRTQSTSKVNLIILISPTIIRTAQQLRDTTDRKILEKEKADSPGKTGEKDYPPRGLEILKDPR